MRAHRFAVILSAATFVLLLIGGIVHGTGSSLACPDWPLCYGEVFPDMVGGVLFEHTHRLVAAGIGVMTIILVVTLWEHRLRTVALAALGLVIGQGVLGGITVIYKLPVLVSSAHLAVSMLFFSTVVYIAYRTRPRETEATSPGATPPVSPSVNNWVLLATGAVYVQVVLGGLVRHTGAGLACLDVPFCQGQLLPMDAHPIVKLQMLHRLVAVAVAAIVLVASVKVYRAAQTGWLRRLALLAPLLVVAQGTLGVLSVLSMLGLWQVTAHLGGGALLLCTMWLMFLATRPALAHRGAWQERETRETEHAA